MHWKVPFFLSYIGCDTIQTAYFFRNCSYAVTAVEWEGSGKGEARFLPLLWFKLFRETEFAHLVIQSKLTFTKPHAFLDLDFRGCTSSISKRTTITMRRFHYTRAFSRCVPPTTSGAAWSICWPLAPSAGAVWKKNIVPNLHVLRWYSRGKQFKRNLWPFRKLLTLQLLSKAQNGIRAKPIWN